MLHNFSQEEREKGRIRSYESRKRNRSLRETMRKILNLPLPPGLAKDAGRDFNGLKARCPLEVIAAAIIRNAMFGDTKSAEFVRDSIGEKPTDRIEATRDQTPLIIDDIK